MKKIRFFCSIGYSDATQEDIVEYRDDATSKEIEEDFLEWKAGIIDAFWKELSTEEKRA